MATQCVNQGWRTFFWGRVPKLSIDLEEIFSRAHGKFEEQNKVLESSIIIINYYVIINKYYNYCRLFTITLRHTTLSRTPLGAGSAHIKDLYPHNTQHSQQTDIHAPGGIRIPNPSKRAATDPRLISHCHWIWQILYVGSLFYVATVICHFTAGSFAELTQPTRPTACRRGRGAAKSDKGYLSDKIMSRVFGV